MFVLYGNQATGPKPSTIVQYLNTNIIKKSLIYCVTA